MKNNLGMNLNETLLIINEMNSQRTKVQQQQQLLTTDDLKPQEYVKDNLQITEESNQINNKGAVKIDKTKSLASTVQQQQQLLSTDDLKSQEYVKDNLQITEEWRRFVRDCNRNTRCCQRMVRRLQKTQER